jgi:hypothetical protein
VFTLVPFFFAVGFSLKWTRDWIRAGCNSASRERRLLIASASTLALVLVALIFCSRVLFEELSAPAALPIASSAIVVGLLVCVWFFQPVETAIAATHHRNLGIALAFAGFICWTAAAEHDHGLMKRVNKVTAGSVAAEFGTATGASSQTGLFAFDPDTKPYSSARTQMVDYVTLKLKDFSKNIDQDKNFTILLTKFDSSHKANLEQNESADWKKFIVEISNLGSNLDSLQKYYRSETSPISFDDKMVDDLRKFYETHTNGANIPCDDYGQAAAAELKSHPTACLTIKESQENFHKRYQELRCRTIEELIILKLPRTTNNEQKSDLKESWKIACTSPMALASLPELSTAQRPPIVDQRVLQLNYIALLVAYGELAAGHAESAAATLDRRIASSKEALAAPITNQPTTTILHRKAAEVSMLRLAVTQLDIMNLTPATRSTLPIVVKGIDTVKLLNSLMREIDPDQKIQRSFKYSNSTAGCPEHTGRDPKATREIIVRWLSTMNNAAYSYSQNLEMFIVQNKYLPEMEDYISNISDVKYDCLDDKDIGINMKYFEASLKHTAGVYLYNKHVALAKKSSMNRHALTQQSELDHLCRAKDNLLNSLAAWKKAPAPAQDLISLDGLLKQETYNILEFDSVSKLDAIEVILRDRHQSRC